MFARGNADRGQVDMPALQAAPESRQPSGQSQTSLGSVAMRSRLDQTPNEPAQADGGAGTVVRGTAASADRPQAAEVTAYSGHSQDSVHLPRDFVGSAENGGGASSGPCPNNQQPGLPVHDNGLTADAEDAQMSGAIRAVSNQTDVSRYFSATSTAPGTNCDLENGGQRLDTGTGPRNGPRNDSFPLTPVTITS